MTTIKTLSRHELAARISRDIPEGWVVNLGIGMPTLIADCVPASREVIFHSENGDLANWAMIGDAAPAVGGAIDLAVGAQRIRVMMDHLTREGAPKLVRRCSYALTAPGVVRRIYTNLAVLDVTAAGFKLIERVEGLSIGELKAKTDAPILI